MCVGGGCAEATLTSIRQVTRGEQACQFACHGHNSARVVVVAVIVVVRGGVPLARDERHGHRIHDLLRTGLHFFCRLPRGCC